MKHFNDQLENYKQSQFGGFIKESLLDSVISESDVIKRALLEKEDIKNVDKKYRNKKVEQQFNDFMEELKKRGVL